MAQLNIEEGEIHLLALFYLRCRMIHEIGTCRMGNDPKKSVLNQFNQMHEAKNVFVTDGSAFVSSANQNPTLTILALTIRACDHLVDELKRGNV